VAAANFFFRLNIDVSELELVSKLLVFVPKSLIVSCEELLDQIIVSLSLWVVDRELLHRDVGRVRELFEWDVNLGEVIRHILGWPLKHNVTVAHQNQLVEVDIAVGAGLVDSCDHSLAFASLLLQKLDN